MKRIPAALVLIIVAISGVAFSAEQGSDIQTRAVSLKVLQSRLRHSLEKGQAPRELLNLCGITKVTGYLVDETKRDLIMLGEVDPTAPPLYAEDLAVAFRSIWLKYAARRGKVIHYQDPGCSIDPDPAVVQRLKEVGQAGVSEEAMDEWCQICEEPQRVRVMGAPFDSRFARVMVEADYLMKRLTDGSVQLDLPGFESLADIRMAVAREALERNESHATGLSLNRFWFYPGNARFREREGVVMIEEMPVVLLTEEQHLTRKGLTGLKRPDPLAQQFAKSFSAHYADIAAQKTIYAELEGLFRLAAFAKLVRYQQERVDLGYLLRDFSVSRVGVPRALPGIPRVASLERRREVPEGYETVTLWMPSCGGVNMGIKIGPHNFMRTPSPKQTGGGKGRTARKTPAGRKAAILKARPSPDALYWDLGKLKVQWQ